MSVQITYSGSVWCEICNTRFHRTIPCKYEGHFCEDCIEDVMPKIDVIYQRMVQGYEKYTWYQRTFKLGNLEKIAYNRYLGEQRIIIARLKAQEIRDES